VPDLSTNNFHPDDRDRVDEAMRRSEETGAPFGAEYRLIASDGRTVWFHDEAVVTARNEDGRPKVVQACCSTSPSASTSRRSSSGP